MAWYSILPSHLTHFESWVVRVFVRSRYTHLSFPLPRELPIPPLTTRSNSSSSACAPSSPGPPSSSSMPPSTFIE